ncbi:MAG: geranylgeranylglyceryl/heptaprenylglyceryl phosphate synthase [Chitinophagales bacterium]|nr:geranylgeranylglyceryl/heptaprenylglyceryl phosphate synthase [Chitinophagales bacterium]HNI43659.1 geranylgeranylglyceryl/heptaprenylglyceryl phosphate synthase [Chitinophagales bacterium]HNL06300.1 geranylgeranylglyceryl/heptaprenylglyceryl phosphate synthase [Chitinophagales bacterium]
MNVYTSLQQARQQQQKKIAVLLDPDNGSPKVVDALVGQAMAARVDYFFVGGSLVMNRQIGQWIQQIKSICNIPVILFPGSLWQVVPEADALFFLSLVSGRNADLLIGQHVVAAPILKQMPIEVMSTAYMLIDGGAPTTVSYISNSTPIPADKAQIAVCTAMAAELLGMKIIYMDSGSGAKNAISESMIQAVSQHVPLPLVVGGGIRTPERAALSCKAGADVVVVGNVLEKDPSLIGEMAKAVHESN